MNDNDKHVRPCWSKVTCHQEPYDVNVTKIEIEKQTNKKADFFF